MRKTGRRYPAPFPIFSLFFYLNATPGGEPKARRSRAGRGWFPGHGERRRGNSGFSAPSAFGSRAGVGGLVMVGCRSGGRGSGGVGQSRWGSEAREAFFGGAVIKYISRRRIKTSIKNAFLAYRTGFRASTHALLYTYHTRKKPCLGFAAVSPGRVASVRQQPKNRLVREIFLGMAGLLAVRGPINISVLYLV